MCQNLLDFFFWGIDRFFISIFLERSELAEFHIINTYARGLMLFFPTFVFLIYPGLLSDLSDKKNNYATGKKLLKYYSFTESFLFCIFSFYILLVPTLIETILPEYKSTYYMLAIILIGLIVKSLSFFYSALIVSRQKQNLLVFISIFFVIITILGYQFLNYSKITGKEYFSLLSVFIFLIYSISLSFFSYKVLKFSTKNALIVVFKLYYRVVILYFLLLIFFLIDLKPLHTSSFIIIFIIFSSYKNIQINTIILFNFLKNRFINL
jgi:O-antigen/teichoic acid export membrane protein